MIIIILAVTGAALAQTDSTTPALPALLERVSAYVETYQQEFGALVCHESYEQKVSRDGRVRQERTLTSDYFLLSFPNHAPVGFRDVSAVDGRPLRNRSKRLRRLFETGAAVDPRTVLRESARHNIGRIGRDVNSPDFPLMYLRRASLDKLQFEIQGGGISEGRQVMQLGFHDAAPQTLIRGKPGHPVTSTGTVQVDAETGRVLLVRVTLREPVTHVNAQVEVRFSPDERLGRWLPAEMHELYWFDTPSPSDRVECHATYSEFSRVVIDTREWFRVPQ
jgi:hypothetical protein